MSNTSHIINAGQAAILQALRDAARLLTLAELQAATSLKESTFRRCHADLRERGYITADRRPGGNHFLFLELSDLGAHALDTHYKRLSGAEAIACEHVEPQHMATTPKDNLFDRPILTLVGMGGYTPQAGSLADRVCSFFAANPSEEMTAYDIAVKFGRNKHSIATLLNQALGAGLLVLARNDDLEFVYGPGPTIGDYQPQVVSKEPPEPMPPVTPPKPARAAAPTKQAQPTVLVLDDIPIEDDVPLPAVNHRPDAQARLAVMTRLLAKLQPGQSAPLPLDAYATLMKAMSTAHADTPAKFSTRRDKDARTLRVWRVE